MNLQRRKSFTLDSSTSRQLGAGLQQRVVHHERNCPNGVRLLTPFFQNHAEYKKIFPCKTLLSQPAIRRTIQKL